MRYFHLLFPPGRRGYPRSCVCGIGLHSLIILKNADVYIFSRGLYFHYIDGKQTIFREEADLVAPPIFQPARLRPAAFRWLAGTSVSAAPKNCLFVLTITPRCFSFNFSNLSKVVIQFQVFRGSEFSGNSTRPSVESWCIHRATVGSPLTFQRSCPERKHAAYLLTCWSNMLA